jgi:hypothetical protein
MKLENRSEASTEKYKSKDNLMIRNTLYGIFLLFIFKFSYSQEKRATKGNFSNNYKLDTIEGLFLYEVNVPYACYSRFDQVEQSPLIIKYDSVQFLRNMRDEYKKGVFFYLYSKSVSSRVDLNEIKSKFKESSVIALLEKLVYIYSKYDSVYMSKVIFDNSKKLMYKKFYAKLVCLNVGQITYMIPELSNYHCCYANIKEQVEAKYILEVLKFEVY